MPYSSSRPGILRPYWGDIMTNHAIIPCPISHATASTENSQLPNLNLPVTWIDPIHPIEPHLLSQLRLPHPFPKQRPKQLVNLRVPPRRLRQPGEHKMLYLLMHLEPQLPAFGRLRVHLFLLFLVTPTMQMYFYWPVSFFIHGAEWETRKHCLERIFILTSIFSFFHLLVSLTHLLSIIHIYDRYLLSNFASWPRTKSCTLVLILDIPRATE